VTKPQTTKWPVHPIADLFPMMTDEELADLAADIKANGLIQRSSSTTAAIAPSAPSSFRSASS
jgi:hypothetical protein